MDASTRAHIPTFIFTRISTYHAVSLVDDEEADISQVAHVRLAQREELPQTTWGRRKHECKLIF